MHVAAAHQALFLECGEANLKSVAGAKDQTKNGLESASALLKIRLFD